MVVELLKSIRRYLSEHPEIKVLEAEESERLRLLIASRFGLVTERTWWWERLPKEAVSLPYSDEEGLDLLLNILPTPTAPFWLFVTDDNPPPWTCIYGTGTNLIEMLREQRFFEYFIVNAGLNWMVFDTHHNTLVMLGTTRRFT